MRKAPRQARSRETVERIIAAARVVLIDDGYDAFSTNRVAAAAGVSPGSLYQYFPDKTAILDVVIDRYWSEVADRVASALTDRIAQNGPTGGDSRPDAGVEMVRAIVDALVGALEADAVLLRVVTEELPPHRLREQRAALELRVRELATAYLAARPAASRRPSAAVAAWVLVLASESLALRWVLDQPAGLTREALLDEMVVLTTNYLSS